ncbi:MAG: response regulator, partial [Bdellovibrionales bacterium]|nr:response regulator [Bdellovibrionales bacterium]
SIDGLRVNQILLNFVSNAIKFTDANGTVRIHLDKGFDEGKGERLICSVTDTGIGMSQEGMKHIFKPFEQAEEDTTHRFGGTGLGLSIVAKLVELMDGEVVVESSPGAGSTFTVQFPLQHVTEGELEEVEEQTEALSQLEDTPSAHILLAEDNRLNQKVAMKLLDNAGHTVVVVNNGKEAVEAYNTESFDLVLMDCHMPIMDGYEATEQIRARETPTRRVPIIAFTANSSEEDTLACIEAGMDGCIQKPFERQELLLAVSRMALHRER